MSFPATEPHENANYNCGEVLSDQQALALKDTLVLNYPPSVGELDMNRAAHAGASDDKLQNSNRVEEGNLSHERNQLLYVR